MNPTPGGDLPSPTTSFDAGDSARVYGPCSSVGVHGRKVDRLHEGETYDTGRGSLPIDRRRSPSGGGTGADVGASLDVVTALTLLSGIGE